MPYPHVAAVAIEDKFGVILVYRVVSKVHILMLKVAGCGFDVLFGCKPGQTFVEHI